MWKIETCFNDEQYYKNKSDAVRYRDTVVVAEYRGEMSEVGEGD